MADSFPVTLYRDEYIKRYEVRRALLRDTVTTETMIEGLDAVFLLVLSDRSAVTRGPNGLIPASASNQSQVTVRLKEAHDLQQRTRFNILTSQGKQRQIMQDTGIVVINKEIDDEIIAALVTGTINVGAAAVMSKALVNEATTRLFNAQIENDGNIFGALTPAAWAYLTDIPSFTSHDYVDGRPVVNGPERKKWMGVIWQMHPRLPGVGTSSASCFIWHRTAIGHAIAEDTIDAQAGYMAEQDYSWARHSLFHGAKLLQNEGVVEILHDDSALSS